MSRTSTRQAGRPAKWSSEQIWQRFFGDDDLPTVRELVEEFQAPRSSIYRHLSLHPDYKRLLAEVNAKRRSVRGRPRRQRRVQVGVPR